MSIFRSTYKDVASTVLENDFLRVEVIECQGGHIASLYDKSEKRELLWQNREKTYKLSKAFDNFDLGECAGIDDMFPTAARAVIAHGKYAGVSLPDHGELWTLCCKGFEQRENKIKMEFRGECLPYKLTKTISLEEQALRVDYTLQNLSNSAFDFIWAAHPLFDASYFDTISVPDMSNTVTIPFSIGTSCEPGVEYAYPITRLPDGAIIDFRTIPPSNINLGYKFMASQPLREGRCEIFNSKSGYGIEVVFPTEKIPYIGVWTFAGQEEPHVVAPEPSTARSVYYNEKSLYDTGTVEASKEFCWWLEYRLKNKLSKKREEEI